MDCCTLAACLTEFVEDELNDVDRAAALEHLGTCPHCEAVLEQTWTVMELARTHGSESLPAERRSALHDSVIRAAKAAVTDRTGDAV